jgi:peptidoglycan-N-acetylglucosamine deacetylase
LLKKCCILLCILNLLAGACVYRIYQSRGEAVSVFSHLQEPNECAPRVALTFDDGPHPKYTEEILDILLEHDVKASFFVMGKNIEGREDIIKRIDAEGHMIGNHTYSHVDLSTLRGDDACEELEKTNNEIRRVLGWEPDFFRPPFGEWKKSLDNCTDLLPVLWTLDTLDWLEQDTQKAYYKVVDNVKENDIILLHDYYEETVDATRCIVEYLLNEGYDFVTVDELILN